MLSRSPPPTEFARLIAVGVLNDDVDAAYLAWRRLPWAPAVELLASSALAVELLVQIPSMALSLLQAILGAALSP